MKIEGGKDSRLASLQRSVLEPLRMDDRLQVEERHLEQAVDYNEVEVPRLRHLPGSCRCSHLQPAAAVDYSMFCTCSRAARACV